MLSLQANKLVKTKQANKQTGRRLLSLIMLTFSFYLPYLGERPNEKKASLTTLYAYIMLVSMFPDPSAKRFLNYMLVLMFPDPSVNFAQNVCAGETS